MIWQPNTYIVYYNKFGDVPSLPEYHWHGSQLIYGNGFVLGGLVLLVILLVLALIAPGPRPAMAAPGAIAQEQHAATPAAGLVTLAEANEPHGSQL
jgi:hypothetical protein